MKEPTMDLKKKSFMGCSPDVMLKSAHFDFSSNMAGSEVMDLT